MPFYKGFSGHIKRIFKQCNIECVFSVANKLNCLIRLGKDRLTNGLNMCSVYKINCLICNACYIGQTKRHVQKRIKEHKSDISKHEGCRSVVSDHRLNNDHDFDWQNIEILHHESHLRKRLVAEMYFIKRHPEAINIQKDTDGFPVLYEPILRNI
ncbi:hypothetical protein X777_00167 [Ooceraea biroi]|uniref:GIY-YIG domain-containing protein n=1 Tax=Ooceraea biroi TaxID=2015173 RepID=A0A026VS13_OOCBI|nr:hypothetical protein X777_00167 [Ooceraea biroi]